MTKVSRGCYGVNSLMQAWIIHKIFCLLIKIDGRNEPRPETSDIILGSEREMRGSQRAKM